MTLPETNNTSPDAVLAPASTKVDSTAQQNVQQPDWEARHKGLQRTYDALRTKYDALVLSHDQLVGEMEELRQGSRRFETEKTTLQNSLAQYEKDKNELEQKLKIKDFEKERTTLIMKEYPDLAGWEAEGLLPSALTIEELKPKLQTFQKKFDDTIGTGVKKKLQGSGPAQSGQKEMQTGHTSEFIYRRLSQLAGHRTPEQEVEYQALHDEWDALEENK